MKQTSSLTTFPMRCWKAREVKNLPLLSPSEAARAYRSAQAETFGGYSLADYGPAKELITPQIGLRGQTFFKSILPKDIE